ncbi:MAG: hypothetical protein R3Y53_03520 [Bacillota bacterium]
MEWLGLFTLLTIYGCFLLSYTSGRWHWWFICFWLLPIFSMTITYESGREINGLMVLICFLMFAICRRSLLGISLWNIKERKNHPILWGFLFVIVFLLILYSFAEAQLRGYMLNIQGWGHDELRWLPILLTMGPMIFCSVIFTNMVYTAIDRLGFRKKNMTLLACRFFISTEMGLESRLMVRGYFVEGVENGVTYYFRMTKRTFYILKKQTFLKMSVKKGIFGGLYVASYEKDPEKERDKSIVKRLDRDAFRMAILGFFVCMAFSLYYIWHLGGTL